MYGWQHGVTSRAYPVTYKFVVEQDGSIITFPTNGVEGDNDAACFPSTCQGGQVFLNIGGKRVRCPSGEFVDLSAEIPGLYRKGLVGPCPDETKMCRTLDCGAAGCNYNGGVCYDGRCICKLGWTGDDCSFSLLQNARVSANGSTVPPAADEGNADAPQHNVTNWYQTVQLNCRIANTTLPVFQSRSSAFLRIVADWSALDYKSIKVINMTTNVFRRRSLQQSGGGGVQVRLLCGGNFILSGLLRHA
jgi:hypothetical protein